MEGPAGQAPQQVTHQIVYESDGHETTQIITESDTKTQYTNLEPMQNLSSSQGYYTTIAQEYSIGPGGVTYLQGPSKGEYYTIQPPGSPNHILYKSEYLVHV